MDATVSSMPMRRSANEVAIQDNSVNDRLEPEQSKELALMGKSANLDLDSVKGASGSKDPVAAEHQATAPSKTVRAWKLCCDLFTEHWFLIGIFLAIGVAAAVPKLCKTGGWIAGQYTIKYGAVIVIFLLTGMSLKTPVLMEAAKRLPLHILIQTISLVLIPLLVWGVVRGLLQAKALDINIVRGLLVCACMPTTVSSNQVFTKQADGNEGLAVINAVLGNLIGIFIAPAMLSAISGASGQAPYADVLKDLAIRVVAPLVVGQLLQYFWAGGVKKLQGWVPFGKVSNCMILLLVLQAFSNTFAQKITVGAASIVLCIGLQLVLFTLFTAGCLYLCYIRVLAVPLRMDRGDAIAMAFVGGTKTMALGLPLINALYGDSAAVGILSLPLLVYHAEQIMFGHLLIRPMKKWRARRPWGLMSPPSEPEATDLPKDLEAGMPPVLPQCLPCSSDPSPSQPQGHSSPYQDQSLPSSLAEPCSLHKCPQPARGSQFGGPGTR